jgi:hypothetical protein
MLEVKKWLEFQALGGGLDPPKQDPTDNPGAWEDYHDEESDELPPTRKTKKKRRKKCKKAIF